jgi:hypothetical protein
MLAPLTRVNRLHHHASGFDQARDLDAECDEDFDEERDNDLKAPGRAGHSKLMWASLRYNRTDICLYK